jgi:ATP-dependent DNA helicase RecQ
LKQLQDILKKYWGYEQFRPLQEDIIQSVLSGKDTLALLPTGGGKSICYQVPAIVSDGVCLVVSPLIALMKDQVDRLKKLQIKAEAIYSGMGYREMDRILDNAVYGDLKFLYISPERLATTLFRARFERMTVSFVAIDEAHCISQWGYDFRPEYLEIARLREIKPDIRFLAVTATATDAVCRDIMLHLHFNGSHLFKSTFSRPNLSLVVRDTEDKQAQLLHILKKTGGSAIIYANTRNDVKNLAGWLVKNGVNADYYHAGLSPAERASKQNEWMQNRMRVMVSTNAFGMGIDKPDVRIVIHHQMPQSPEAYFQEAGRAGRDGQKSYAILLHHLVDDDILKARVEGRFPPFALVRDHYDRICNYLQVALGDGLYTSFDFDLVAFAEKFKVPVPEALSCIQILETEGYFRQSEGLSEPARLMILLDEKALYKLYIASPAVEKMMLTLLRMYGTLFDHHTAIREEEIAARLKVSKEKTLSLLQQLHRIGAVDFIPRKNSPQLTFLQPRVRKTDLIFDAARTKALAEQARARLAFMLSYTGNHTECRSEMMQAYFGEPQAGPCGICDVCLANRRAIMQTSTDEIRLQVLQCLKAGPQTAELLVERCARFGRPAVLETLRWMNDNDETIHKSEYIYLSDQLQHEHES